MTPWGFTLEQAFEAMRFRAVVENDPHPYNSYNPDRLEETATNVFGDWMKCKYPSCRKDRGAQKLCYPHIRELKVFREERDAKALRMKEEARAVKAAEAEARALRRRYNGPDRAGYVYRMYDVEDNLLYVGKTYSVEKRLYGTLGHANTKDWFSEVDTVHVREYLTESDALMAEGFAIRGERPRYNRTMPSGRDSEPVCVSEYWERAELN